MLYLAIILALSASGKSYGESFQMKMLVQAITARTSDENHDLKRQLK